MGNVLSELNNIIEIGPNPFFNKLSIQSSILKLKYVMLYDLQGKQILRLVDCVENSITINTQNVKEGMYLLKIETEAGSVAIFKIVKN